MTARHLCPASTCSASVADVVGAAAARSVPRIRAPPSVHQPTAPAAAAAAAAAVCAHPQGQRAAHSHVPACAARLGHAARAPHAAPRGGGQGCRTRARGSCRPAGPWGHMRALCTCVCVRVRRVDLYPRACMCAIVCNWACVRVHALAWILRQGRALRAAGAGQQAAWPAAAPYEPKVSARKAQAL